MLRSLAVPDEPSLARALELELADQFPPGSRIIPWRRGADFFALRVVPPGAVAERVLRVPLRGVTTSVYDATVDFGDVVEREAFVHGLLERRGVPVAPLLGWGRASGTDAHSWMMFERVAHDDRASLSPPALAALGRVLRRGTRHRRDPRPGGGGRPADGSGGEARAGADAGVGAGRTRRVPGVG